MQAGNWATAGIVLLTIVAIAYGGTFLLRIATGKQGANDLQKTFFRAGHAHAGVLVILGLVMLLLLDAAGVGAPYSLAADGVLFSAILIPGGFFLSAVGHDPARPNRFVLLLWAGFALLTASVVLGGIGLILA